jgi:hypothetical protein
VRMGNKYHPILNLEADEATERGVLMMS